MKKVEEKFTTLADSALKRLVTDIYSIEYKQGYQLDSIVKGDGDWILRFKKKEL